MKMETVCIVCPNGCRLTVESTARGLVVKGNTCPKGERYGKDEATDPRRVVTAVVLTGSEDHPCVPVKTTAALPRDRIPSLLKTLYALRVPLPAKRGQTVIDDFDGTGVGVVCTRTIPYARGRRS